MLTARWPRGLALEFLEPISFNSRRGFFRFVFANCASAIDRAARFFKRVGWWRLIGIADPHPHMASTPPRALIRPLQKICRSKKPRRSKDLLLLCPLKPHRLFRFLAGDHYAKRKSIAD